MTTAEIVCNCSDSCEIICDSRNANCHGLSQRVDQEKQASRRSSVTVVTVLPTEAEKRRDYSNRPTGFSSGDRPSTLSPLSQMISEKPVSAGRQAVTVRDSGAASVTRSPSQWIAGLLDAIGAARQGRKWQCPAHGLVGEHSVALAVSDRRDGRGAVLWCYAGCELDAVLRALRLTRADLVNPPPVEPARHAKAWRLVRKFPPPKCVGAPSERGFRFEAEHFYGYPQPIAKKVRLRHPTSGAKEITWESLNPRGEWVPGLLGRRQIELPLYRLREVRMAVAAEETVVLCESESSVDALAGVGIYATCWPGGAGDPPIDEIHRELTASRTVLIPDNDDAGLKCRDRIVSDEWSPRVVLGEPGEDARDMLKRMGSNAFRAMIEEIR